MPDVYPLLVYRDAPAAIRFLTSAFGLSEHLVVPGEGGQVLHAQLAWGQGIVMLRSLRPDDDEGVLGRAVLHLAVEDPDAHHARAVKHRAEIAQGLADEVHGRGYLARDPEGNAWSFGTYRPEVE